MRKRHSRAVTSQLAAIAAVTLFGLPATTRADQSSAYLWSVRRGCQVDSPLEEATHSRIRGVGRRIALLTVPASAETRSCSGRSCADIVRRTAWCNELNGPLLGAELDEDQGPSGIINRVRAWRYDLAKDAGGSLTQDFLTCPAERCGYHELQELVAKALNRLLDRPPVSATDGLNQAAFAAPECTRPASGAASAPPPAYCEQPLGAGCAAAELSVPEPSGRLAVLHHAANRPRPRATPQSWEWLPITGSIVGLGTTIGLGAANESVTIGSKYNHVLTPAFWTSAALTVVLAASSAAVVGSRYRREMGALKEDPAPDSCALLLDSHVGGKEA